VVLNAGRRPSTGKVAVFSLAERPLAGVAVTLGKPEAKKYLFTNSAGNPNAIVHNLLLVVVAKIEWVCVYCLCVHEFPLIMLSRFAQPRRDSREPRELAGPATAGSGTQHWGR
jgi:hypothetical protein